ncbi:hypothetical protein COHA_001736 [Chlorella ohadii]|uniref:NodB homology domain-containing protein n=1 Tax=Chlorella ohadii TaxID=2649997 RepID=A0AAD5DX51_9CHLO|nr:hypothetical protein COHA_001736 [Chlorella ohadii]
MARNLRRAPLQAAAAALLLVSLQPFVSCAEVRASSNPPGGLKPSETPQFILWSFDDEINKESTDLVLKVSEQRRNPNGCKVPVTWFACTSVFCDFQCDFAKKLHDAGHEIGVHTRTHAGLRFIYDRKTVEDEILGSRTDALACGLPEGSVQGFRTPYLATSPTVREVLSKGGFRYDSSIGVKGGKDKLWPATLEKGMPYNCELGGGSECLPDESYPGFWEVPLYTTVEHENLMDYCTVEGDGSKVAGCSAFEVLKKSLDEAYDSNRGPVTVGTHKAYMRDSEFSADVGKFLDYALSKPDVWVVTHQQLLDWMEAPVPTSQMKSFMAQYECAT